MFATIDPGGPELRLGVGSGAPGGYDEAVQDDGGVLYVVVDPAAVLVSGFLLLRGQAMHRVADTTHAVFRTAEEAMRSDVLTRMRTYKEVPPELDLHMAKAAELRRRGLPRRPDPETEPRLAELWERAFDRRFQYVSATLHIDPILGRRDPLWRRPGDPQGLEDEGSYGPSGWGGVVARPARRGFTTPSGRQVRANTVYAQWTIPGVFPASNPAGDITAGFWVGLDGWGNGQVLQAGVAVTVHPDPLSVEWRAWTEWWTKKYKDPAVYIDRDQFPVNVGDTVAVLVCAPSPDHGFAAFHNITTNRATSVRIDQPAKDITSEGATAEWIVEGISADLPVFLPSVTFTSCAAGTASSSFDLIPLGFTTEIAGATPGSQLTHTTIASDSIAVVEWKGWT